MDSPRISFDEESQPSTQSIKDPKESDFCQHVGLFLLAFVLVTILALVKFFVLYDLLHSCPRNRTHPVNHEIFLRNSSIGS